MGDGREQAGRRLVLGDDAGVHTQEDVLAPIKRVDHIVEFDDTMVHQVVVYVANLTVQWEDVVVAEFDVFRNVREVQRWFGGVVKNGVGRGRFNGGGGIGGGSGGSGGFVFLMLRRWWSFLVVSQFLRLPRRILIL